MNGTGIRDVTVLARMEKLEQIDLRETQIVDVMPLVSLPALKKLELTGSRVTPGGVAAFREAAPKVEVVGP